MEGNNQNFKESNNLMKGKSDDLEKQDTYNIANELLRGAFENAAIAISITDINGKFQRINNAFSYLTGYNWDDLINKTFYDITHPDDLDKNKAYVKILVDNNTDVLTLEKRYIKKDGSVIWVSINASLINDVSNNPVYFIQQIVDITKQKQLIDDLELSRNKLAAILDNTRQIFILLDKKLKITAFNREADRFIFNFLEKSIEPGDHIMELLNSMKIDFPVEMFEKTFSNINSKSEFLIPCYHTDDQWYEIELIPIKNEAGEITGICLNGSNISERKKNENEIYKLSQSVEQSPNAIAFFNTSGTITYVNHKFPEITGYFAEDVINKKMAMKFLGATTDDEYYKICRIVGRFGEWRGEILNYRKNGDTWWEWITLSGIVDHEGKIVQYVLIMDDISARKKMEIELIHAKEKAEESNRLKSNFLDNMSHEIRTPLNAIIGFTQILQIKDISEEERTESIENLTRSSDNLLKIISDIIDLSKIESNTIILHKTRVSVKDIINEISDEIPKDKIGFVKKDVAFKVSFDQTDQTILLTDKERLKKAISCVLDNAIKFTHKGFVSFGFEKQSNKNAVFYVKDSGIGIPSDKRHIIFERFRQVDDSSTRKYGGLGIGLTISTAIIRQLGGMIWFDSASGEGSEFYISVPAFIENSKASIPDGIITNLPERRNLKGYTILIADDNNANIDLLKTFLLRKEAGVLVAKDGNEAVEMCKTHAEISLILMDLQMPLINGLEATRMIKKIRKDLPIIAQTAYSIGFNMTDALAAGCNDYVIKPIKLSVLESKILSFLK